MIENLTEVVQVAPIEATKERMKALRKTVTCISPSGFEVTLIPPSLERHALSGGLPSRLRDIAQSGPIAIDKAIAESKDGDPELLTYLDGIVARLFASPVFVPPVWEFKRDTSGKELLYDDSGAEVKQGGHRAVVCVSGDNLDEYLLPADYRWALLIAFGEMDEDGEGNPLWGRESLSKRFATFPDESGGAAGGEGAA